MLKLEEIKKDAAVSGIDPIHPVRVVTTELVGENALTVYYKTIGGVVLEHLFSDEEKIALHQPHGNGCDDGLQDANARCVCQRLLAAALLLLCFEAGIRF